MTMVQQPARPAAQTASSGRSYLDVPYAEKDAAKAAGARWDPTARRWYAPRGSTPGLQRWAARPEVPEVLPGEDRSFGAGLFVDLVPRSCWFTKSQFAELGEDDLLQPVLVDVERRVLAALADLAEPHVGRLTEPGVGAEQFRSAAAALTQLVLQRGARRRLRGAPSFGTASDAVEVADAAAGNPSTVFTLELDVAVLAERERGTGHGAAAPGRVSVGFPTGWIFPRE
jgi:hypothetical protein